MSGREYRKGFGRLAALLWATGALGVLALSGETRRWPLDDVCTLETAPPYEECFSEAARERIQSESFSERLMGRFRRGWEGVDAEREIPRWRTARYQEAVVSMAKRQLAWALGVWGPFYLLAWAFAGFRASEAGSD